MKKNVVLLIFAFCILSVSCVSAFDEVNLDLSTDKKEEIIINKSFENSQGKIDVITEKMKENINPQNIYEETNRDLYSKKTISSKKEKKFDKMTVGVKSDTTLAPESATQTRTLYSNYDITEKMSVGTSYKNSSNGIVGTPSQGSVSVGPEYKINKKISIKNEYSKDFGAQAKKEELKLNVSPYEDGRMNFNVGVGQQQMDNGGASSSQVNFGTNFRF